MYIETMQTPLLDRTDDMFDGSARPTPARTGSTAAIVRSLAVVALLAVAAFAAFGRSTTQDTAQEAAATASTAPELTVVAADIAAATMEHPEAKSAVGAYVAQTGVLVEVQLQGIAPSGLAAWFADIASPFADRLAGLPTGEALVVSLDLLDAPAAGRVLRITGDEVSTPTAWEQFAVTGAIIAKTTGDGDPAVGGDAPDQQGTGEQGTGEQGAGAPGTGPATSDPVTSDPGATGSTTDSTAPSTTIAAGTLYDDFSGTADQWKVLAGTWQVADGVYRQTDAGGFDLISRFTAAVPASYTFEVRMKAAGGPLNAGVIVGQPTPGTREGATVIDITDNGGYLRWGRYATSGGAYEFVGGAVLAAPLDATQWHTLKVVVKGDTTVVFVDDVQIGDAGPIGAGSVGLVTSQAAIDFDDVKVTPG